MKRLIAISLLLTLVAFSTYNTSSVSNPVVPEVQANPVVPEKNSETSNNHRTTEPADMSATTSVVSSERSTTKPAQAAYPEKREGNTIVTTAGKRLPLVQYEPLLTPNDPNASQWWTDTVNMPGAWGVGAGNEETVLAIIDTGFALGHEEFSNRWHENTGEKGITTAENPSRLNCTDRGLPLDRSCNLVDDNGDGVVDNETGATSIENKSQLNCTDQSVPLDKSCNLVDDEGNGFVDDWRGFDFINFDRSVEAGETNTLGTGTTHGTLVSGVAAATGNNGVGVAGVDWTTKILPLQALDDDSYGDSLSVGRAIRYAADQSADVISISLGASVSDSFLRSAVQYAIAKGSIVVAASGNDGCRCISYPANYEEVVAVGASDQLDARASFSNWGPNLDIIAPGVGLRSTTWSRFNATSAYVSSASGTSFATPLVAGLLTLARSHQPDASAQQLIATLTEQSNRLTIPNGTVKTETFGYGRAQANAMLARASTSNTSLLRTGFQKVSGGRSIGNYEPAIPFTIYPCDTTRPGTTEVYRLAKGNSVVHTISAVERHQAMAQGYSSTLFGTMCLNLPTDQPEQIRMLSIPSEFENRFVKE